jgi:hypothetical protein
MVRSYSSVINNYWAVSLGLCYRYLAILFVFVLIGHLALVALHGQLIYC